MADAIISIVVDQLSIIIKDQIQDVRAALGVEKEIKNLSSKLNKIRAVLNDAERRSFNEEIVKLWVDEIKDFCYDVEDVVDEWNTRSRRQQIERSPEVAGRCSSFLPCCFHFKKIVMHGDIANKIKELDSRLDRITKEKDQFNFLAVASLHPDQELKRVSTPFDVDATEIQGRESDASGLISKLVEDNDNGPPVVISIVGAGGIGKTTLAQLVYGDEQIKAHFDERVWVCVSQPFDQIKIAKDIVHSISSENLSEQSLQVLLGKIQSTLSQKRFLLVLDDVWTEEDAMWAPFKNCLKVGLPGSRILVTSRSERVARMMASVYLHRVDLISDSDAWLLLSKIAFSGGRDDAYSKKLEEIGKQIAQKCKGLPLAVKVMGSLLRNKDTEEEWQTVLSQLDTKFSNVEGVETDLFPHLRLSYDDLTPQMKRCFSYCAVFPKDYRIDVDELIRIWMAQGYLTTTNGSDHNNQMEQKGREIFNNLAMRSLFQDFEKHRRDSNIIISCKMHDIVHDFAEFLTKTECYSVVWQEDKVKIENLRHLSWQKTGSPIDLASNYDVLGKLRTFFAKDLSPEQLTANMFNGLKSVRVLGLHSCMLPKLPKEIGNLIHLRYIDLSWSKIVELPDSICSLDNLQTLNLQECECLSRLPEGIGNLHKLRKIDLSWSKVDELPDSICCLDNLQTLNLRECNCLSRLPERIGKLRNLSEIDLRSEVEELPDSICSLDNLKILNLDGCECLSRLPERIGNLRNLSEIDLSRTKVEELPDSLCSLDNLEYLGLDGCECLSRLPEDIGNLRHLSEIHLSWSKVEELPDSICSLDNLKILNLEECECLSRLPERIGNLRNLREIYLCRSKVEELPDSICSLDKLVTLFLEGCECLSRLPERIGNLRNLIEIDLSSCKVEELPDSICSLDNLKILDLGGCKCLSRLPGGIGNLHHLRDIDLSWSKVEELPDSIWSLNNLESLSLAGCECLSRLPEDIENLRHLSEIYLNWSKVEELPDSICSLDNLKYLDLDGCECLSRLPEDIGNLRHLSEIHLSRSKVEELPDSICSLDNLQTLNLRGCECLSRLPEEIGNLRNLSKIYLSMSKVEELPDSICSLDNLEILDLKGCECLSRLPDGVGNLHKLRLIDLRGCKVELPDSIYSLNNLKIRAGELGRDISESEYCSE
ncbi:putative disease resistance protein RGA3 [Ipomoea triloba]|uniref:putative disease resistance protein RGA3 n=1 Tax=Ipomoea triloba TaxID=35885 RepID=UPI00125E7CC6|nr:putative disease resistance protein RGA3 [Ipomoea triloba]XP_031129836.1 putative disease resistance protein RGA3 [Ipomoea triloba]XP_031129837.1 putative disease resistance protein RGA3 [Ipomoea triloba]XP_031129838.1 putative disease resistance protein RGA3 [Ipomoea triloba]